MSECHLMRESMPLLLTESLDRDRRELTHQHIETCAACSEEWAAYRESWAMMADLPDGWIAQCRDTVELIDQRIGEYERMLEDNPFFMARARGVGVISRDLAEDVGISGPLLRGSGVLFDLRRAEPYSSYDDFEFAVPSESIDVGRMSLPWR